MDPIRFTLDGAPVELTPVDPKAPALGLLREQLGVGGVKAGCSPQGSCGACTILVDGKPRLSCTLPAKSLAGKAVGTLAGVAAPTRDALVDAFAAEAAAQCGYCTPGILLSGAALVAAGRAPTDEELDRALAPHVCRCTGYAAIRRALTRAATAAAAPPAPAPARECIEGARPYVDDLERPGALHGAVILAGGGVLRGVDLGALGAEPGVVAVLPLVEPGAELGAAPVPVVAIAAHTRAQARAAAEAHPAAVEPSPPPEPTPLLRAVRREGDAVAAMAGCAEHRRVSLRLAPTDAAPLEPESALAVPTPAGLTLYASGHHAGALAAHVGAAVGAPVRVRLLPSGGSYGARRVPTIEAAAARLALATARPVKLTLDHEEGTALRARRPAATVEAELGLDAAGRPRALRLQVRFEGGTIAHEPERLLADAVDALDLELDAVELVAEVLRTPGAPTAPLRGAGARPVALALAALLDGHLPDGRTDALRAALPAGLPAAAGRAPGGRGATVRLCVTDAATVEVQCDVPELGQGRDAALLAALGEATGLPEAAFDIAWTDSTALSSSGEGPVDAAAAEAGRALRAVGGPLAAQRGAVHLGRSGPADEGLAAAAVQLDEQGAIAQITVAVAVGVQDEALTRSLAEGGAAMGVELALAAEVPRTEQGDEGRFRYLGALKSRQVPRLQILPVRLPGGPREVDEAACVAVEAAVFAAVRRFGEAGERLPLKDSAAARAVGVRPPRPRG